jgi:hypothetical protein
MFVVWSHKATLDFRPSFELVLQTPQQSLSLGDRKTEGKVFQFSSLCGMKSKLFNIAL